MILFPCCKAEQAFSIEINKAAPVQLSTQPLEFETTHSKIAEEDQGPQISSPIKINSVYKKTTFKMTKRHLQLLHSRYVPDEPTSFTDLKKVDNYLSHLKYIQNLPRSNAA